MKEDIIRRAIGDIDDDLIEGAKEASAAPRKKRKTVVLKRVAVAALAVVLATFGLLMLNANVRAAVLGVFIGTDSEGNTVVRFGENEESGTTDPVDVNDVMIGYVPEGLTAEEITGEDMLNDYRIIGMKSNDGKYTYAEVRIMSERVFDTKFSPGSFDYFSPTTVNGMDAFYTDDMDFIGEEYIASSGMDPDFFRGGLIIFGDGEIIISVSGYNISMDEIIRIAENVTW